MDAELLQVFVDFITGVVCAWAFIQGVSLLGR